MSRGVPDEQWSWGPMGAAIVKGSRTTRAARLENKAFGAIVDGLKMNENVDLELLKFHVYRRCLYTMSCCTDSPL
jgi:hypothetical protein